MIKDVVFRFLSREPQSLEDLAIETGIDRATIRSVLISEIYVEREVDHKDAGRVKAWILNPKSRVRVDDHGIYTFVDST